MFFVALWGALVTIFGFLETFLGFILSDLGTRLHTFGRIQQEISNIDALKALQDTLGYCRMC